MKCLVTGGGGFIGAEIVKQLIAHGHKVRVLLRNGEIPSNLVGIDVEVCQGDIRDRPALDQTVKDIDHVFHTASVYESTPFYVRRPKRLYEINIEGTRNICDASLKAGVKKLVYTSSTAAVGMRDDGEPADESVKLNALERRSHYEKSKALAEELALSYNQKGLWVAAVNPSFLIGPGDLRPSPTGEIIVKFLNKIYPCYFDAIACLTDLTSAAKAHLDVLERGRAGERYIVAMDHHFTIQELFETLEKVSGVKSPRLKVPLGALGVMSMLNEAILGILGLRKRFKPIISYEVVRYLSLRCQYDSSKAKKELGYKASSLEEVTQKSVKWYVKNGYVRKSMSERCMEHWNISRADFQEAN